MVDVIQMTILTIRLTLFNIMSAFRTSPNKDLCGDSKYIRTMFKKYVLHLQHFSYKQIL